MSELEGILLIDKPAGFTSFDVVARLRGMTHTRRIGHAGTLDPMATGVLPVFFGRSAKAIELLPDHDKTYLASFALGVTTDTQDNTGEVLSCSGEFASKREVEAAIPEFIGEQPQLPPMYSAVRVKGQRLYDLARQGVEVKREPRMITVYDIALVSADEKSGLYTVRVSCSRGTYIRTLCHDLGARLGCGAVLTALRREKACGFSVSDCITMEDAQRLADEKNLTERLFPVSSAFAYLQKLYLTEKQAVHFKNGVNLGLSQFKSKPADGLDLAVFEESGRFLGIAVPDRKSGGLTIKKLFALRENT